MLISRIVFEMPKGGSYIQASEAVYVAECGGEEGVYVVLVLEKLMDVEELVPRSAKEAFRLLRVGGLGEVDLCPKGRCRE